jgi:hypothetical protein
MHTIRCKRAFALLGVALLLGACSYPGMVRLSTDTYRLSRADAGHVYADTAALRAAVAADAQAFAQRKGMTAVEVAVHEDTLQIGHLSTIDYDFRLVPPALAATPSPAVAAAAPSTPAAVAAAPAAPAAVVTPAAAATPLPIAPAQAPAPAVAQRNYYDELIRLDDLRKRGILTEDEFQTLKAKILAGR